VFLWSFGILCGHLVNIVGVFFTIRYVAPRKIWQPCLGRLATTNNPHPINFLEIRQSLNPGRDNEVPK
jgi:hypothetical protein